MSVKVSKTKAGVNIAALDDEINANANIAKVCEGVSLTGADQLDIYFDLALSGAEDTELDAVLAGQPGLVEHKDTKTAAIEAKTETMLKTGFVHGGEDFRLRERHVNRYTALHNALKDGVLTYPRKVMAKGKKVFTIPDVATLDAWFSDMASRASYILEGETQLVADVDAAVDKAAVDAISDDRV